VLIDGEKCTGCRICYEECPYGAPVFEGDNQDALAQKCDMCIDRLEAGKLPICVLACSARALDFGPMSEMRSRYGSNRDLEDLPDSRTTKPSVVFKPHAVKQQIVPYDAKKALELMCGETHCRRYSMQYPMLLRFLKGRLDGVNW
jgi:anaerobic dimethyl sulfoxide reductase subunit B (iron-sulfur subunit)